MLSEAQAKERDREHWRQWCPWCAAHISELTGTCYCGRKPPETTQFTEEKGSEG